MPQSAVARAEQQRLEDRLQSRWPKVHEKAACSSVRGHFCFDGNESVAKAPRHRVNVARETGTGAQGAGLDFFCALNLRLIEWVLALAVDAFHIDNLAAKGSQHLLNGGIILGSFAQTLFFSAFQFFL